MMAHVGRAFAGVASRQAPMAAAARSLASPLPSSPLAMVARPQSRGAATLTCREALNSAIDEEMEREESTPLPCGTMAAVGLARGRWGGSVWSGLADPTVAPVSAPLAPPSVGLFAATAEVSDCSLRGSWSVVFPVSSVAGMQRCM